MPSLSDPVARARAALLSTAAAAVVGLAACAWWAASAPAPPNAAVLGSAPSAPPAPVPAAALDPADFAAILWTPDPIVATPTPRAPAPTPRTAVPPPPRFELVAITRDTAGDGAVLLRAALYDPAADLLLLVLPGGPVGAGTLREIGPGWVEVADAKGATLRLTLLREEPAP